MLVTITVIFFWFSLQSQEAVTVPLQKSVGELILVEHKKRITAASLLKFVRVYDQVRVRVTCHLKHEGC